MWESTIDSIKRDLDRLHTQIQSYGSDAISGGRAVILEFGFEQLREQLQALTNELKYCEYKFQSDPLEGQMKPVRYVVAQRGGTLFFLYNNSTEGDLGHLTLLERRGFRKEASLGGGFVTIDLDDRRVSLTGSSTSLGPDQVRKLIEEKLTSLMFELNNPLDEKSGRRSPWIKK
jgi:hypothetical protein